MSRSRYRLPGILLLALFFSQAGPAAPASGPASRCRSPCSIQREPCATAVGSLTSALDAGSAWCIRIMPTTMLATPNTFHHEAD